LRDPAEVHAVFREGLSTSLLCLPRADDALAILERAFHFWFPRLLESGYGAVPMGLAIDLGGMLLSGRGERLTATGASFGGRGESLDERIQRVFQMRTWLDRTPAITRLRKLLLGRRDDVECLDGAVLGIIRRSTLGRAACLNIPSVVVSRDVFRRALRYPLGAVLRKRSAHRLARGKLFQPFLSAWRERLASGMELFMDIRSRLAVEASVFSRSPLISPDFDLLSRTMEGLREFAPRREREVLWLRARRKLSERAGSRLAFASGGYTGIRRAQTLEEMGRLLSTEWALPEETLIKRILDKESPVLEVQGREEPAWEILFTVVVVQDPLALSSDFRGGHDPRALALWFLDDIAKAIALDGGRASAEILVLSPDPDRFGHFRFSLQGDTPSQPLFLGEEALFPAYFLREPPGRVPLEVRRPQGEEGMLSCDVMPRGIRLEIPREANLECLETRPHAKHVIAVLPGALEFGARYRIEAEEPFGPLDLSLGGNDSLSMVFQREKGWTLSPLGYPPPGGQVVLPTADLRKKVLTGICHRLSARS